MEGNEDVRKKSGLMTIDELAALLRIPKKTIYGWVHHREIPFLKVGRHLRFVGDAVLDHFKQKTKLLTEPCSSPKRLIDNRRPRSLKIQKAASS